MKTAHTHFGQVKRFKYLVAWQKGKQPAGLSVLPDNSEWLPYLTMEYLRGEASASTLYARPENNSVVANNDDIILLWDGANAGEFLEGKHGLVSSTAALLRSRYACRSAQSRLQQTTVGMGIPHVNGDSLGQMLFSVPSSAEQRSIAAYLDEQTGKIDRLMDMRRRQMALLKEQRAALIQQAVTRGLNPNVAMKDTALPWLGEIPAHWEVRKLKGLTSILTCGYASTPDYVSDEVGVPFLSAQNVQKNKLLLKKYNFIPKQLHQQLTRYRRPVIGDILVTRVGAGIGDACVVDTDLEFSVYVSLTHIRTSKELLNTFLVYFFQTRYSKLLNGDGTVVGGGVGNLNVQNLARYPFPLPPMHEQRSIVEYLDIEGVKTDRLLSAYTRQMELLTEYRAALIHECVTGQRTVPEIANV
jgi:type I restriction enzyme S subunit